jgi:hypothetical protein
MGNALLIKIVEELVDAYKPELSKKLPEEIVQGFNGNFFCYL